MIRSFLRSTIYKYPSASCRPKSPVWSQPSLKTSAVVGLNVYPREVEEVLATHPAVVEVAVIGVPDPTRGEVPKAYVVVGPGATTSKRELLRFVRERLASFKVPREVEFCQNLPRTISGKVLRQQLRPPAEAS